MSLTVWPAQICFEGVKKKKTAQSWVGREGDKSGKSCGEHGKYDQI